MSRLQKIIHFFAYPEDFELGIEPSINRWIPIQKIEGQAFTETLMIRVSEYGWIGIEYIPSDSIRLKK